MKTHSTVPSSLLLTTKEKTSPISSDSRTTSYIDSPSLSEFCVKGGKGTSYLSLSESDSCIQQKIIIKKNIEKLFKLNKSFAYSLNSSMALTLNLKT